MYLKCLKNIPIRKTVGIGVIWLIVVFVLSCLFCCEKALADSYSVDYKSHKQPDITLRYEKPLVKDDRVAWLQCALNALIMKDLLDTAPIKVDSVFGDECHHAVTLFQKTYGLKEDGICGSKTLSKIRKLLEGSEQENDMDSEESSGSEYVGTYSSSSSSVFGGKIFENTAVIAIIFAVIFIVIIKVLFSSSGRDNGNNNQGGQQITQNNFYWW